MKKIIQLLLLHITLLVSNFLQAQQKYALLVGINKYYSKPGVLYPRVLQGCVNDALSIQSVLERRFGFDKDNIITLVDEKASKQNVLASFENIISKIKAGDAFVFFFSGHGVWMTNNDQSKLDQAIKDKMNQAMVMSDLYAKNLDCLFTDGLLKKTINRFVDKRAVVTTIFDCCYSGRLVAVTNPLAQNPYPWEEIPGEQKSFSFRDVYDAFSEYCMEHTDSCQLDHLNDSLNATFFPAEETRSFNITDNLTVNNSEHVIRPSERPQSMFASLAGTDDRTKGLEIKDETGTYHGAYTRALLYALEKSTYTTALKQIIEITDAALKKQLYQQEPMYMNDPSRLSKNFLGINPIGFTNTITVQCDAINSGHVNINAGLNDGVRPGNIFTSGKPGNKIVLQIETSNTDNSVAGAVSGNIGMLKKGDPLILTNSYIKSTPIIKVFIEDGALSNTAFQQFVAQKIMPLTKLSSYWDYENWYNDQCNTILFNRKTSNPSAEELSASMLKNQSQIHCVVYLPIPSGITSALKKAFAKNQNFKLVQNEREADYSLVLNYTKALPGYVFTWVKIPSDVTAIQYERFNKHNVKLKAIPASEGQLRKLTADIILMTGRVARSKSNQWLNEYDLK